MDDDDAAFFAIGDGMEVSFLALENDLAFIIAGWVDARKHLHKRGFSGAILAHQRVDFAMLDGEIDVFERVDARKAFGDAAHFENGGHGLRVFVAERIGRGTKGAASQAGGAYWVIWSSV